MNRHDPDNSRPEAHTATQSSRLVVAIFVGSLLWILLCGGVGIAVAVRKAAKAKNPSLLSPNDKALLRHEWWTARESLQVYIAVLDAVAQDPQVIDCLGDPIQTDGQAEELYRRSWTGPLAYKEGGTIRFDLHGTKQNAVVNVDVVVAQGPKLSIR